MYIAGLSIKDFLGIRTLKIDKAGKLNLIVGKNGQGKTAVLEAITATLKSLGRDAEVVRNGADSAEILMALSNGVTVERKMTRTNNTLKVKNAQGTPMDSPQSFLNELFEAFSFNPVDFFQAKPKERREVLLAALPLTLDEQWLLDFVKADAEADLSDLVDLRQIDFTKHGLEVLGKVKALVYDTRTEANKTKDRLKKSIEQERREIPENFDPKAVRSFDLNAAVGQVKDAERILSDHKAKQREIESLRKRNEDIKLEQADIDEQIKKFEARKVSLEAERAEIVDKGTRLREEIEAFVQPDVADTQRQIDEYRTNQKYLSRMDSIADREKEFEKAGEEWSTLDAVHKVLDKEVSRELLKQIDSDLGDGVTLEFEGDVIRVNGVSLDKLSDSEKIRFGVNVARSLARSKDLKLICIDGFEALDPDNQDEFRKATEGDEFQYFITLAARGDLTVEREGEMVEAAS